MDAYAPITGSHVRRPTVNGTRGPSTSRRPATSARTRRVSAVWSRSASAAATRDAARGARRLVCHFWWHPHDFGRHLNENLAVLAQLLTCFRDLRERTAWRASRWDEVSDRTYA
jgi:hypothetical protein